MICLDNSEVEAIKISKKRYIIWYTGSKEQAEYIQNYVPLLKNNSIIASLPDSAIKSPDKRLPENFLRYFFLDFPDVIISDKHSGEIQEGKIIGNSLPVLGIEILEQKPVGWNHIQRFPRGAASAILGVPFAYLEPIKRYMFDKGWSSDATKNYVIANEKYKENLREEFQLPYTLHSIMKVHDTPCLTFMWTIDVFNKFISEGLVYNLDRNLRWKGLPPSPSQGDSEIKSFFEFVNTSIYYHEKDKNPSELFKEKVVRDCLLKISPNATKPLYSKRNIQLKKPFRGNIKIVRIDNTSDIIKILSRTFGQYFNLLLNSQYLKNFIKREKTVVCEIDSDPDKGGRGFSDPYSGVIAAFDYRECRNKTSSKDIKSRDCNLVFLNNLNKTIRNRSASKWFEDQIRIQFNSDGLDDKDFPLNLKFEQRKNLNDTINITKRMSAVPQYTQNKTIKNFFTFCDLIIFSDNLFVGKPLLLSI